jgi:FkbM family methyltransferase
MVEKLSFVIFRTLSFFDFLFFKITKRKFLPFFHKFLENDSYNVIKILNKDINFFVPNSLVKWRVETFFIKEPETLEWIDSFDDNSKIIFWDIGANIGLYSIYAALKFKNIEVVSFEPSTSNLRVLSRNISINKLENKIKINQFPLTNKENKYLIMKEGDFVEGGALNSFGEDFNFEGGSLNAQNNYQVYGTTINYLLKSNILLIPDYIKIDVDGLEHFILEGGDKFLGDKKVKSISIEINENFVDQYDAIHKFMKQFNFVFKHKKHNDKLFDNDGPYSKTYNYVFEKQALII